MKLTEASLLHGPKIDMERQPPRDSEKRQECTNGFFDIVAAGCYVSGYGSMRDLPDKQFFPSGHLLFVQSFSFILDAMQSEQTASSRDTSSAPRNAGVPPMATAREPRPTMNEKNFILD